MFEALASVVAGAVEPDRRGEPVTGGERHPLARDHGHRAPPGVQRRHHRHQSRRGPGLQVQGDHGNIIFRYGVIL